MTIKRILIVGGGTSGWMTAAMLSKLTNQTLDIQLVESENIATIGVGEATIPAIKRFNHLLGINEAEFLSATQGTFKLGIQFENWGGLGTSYMHSFGKIGRQWDWLSFHQYWLKLHQQGLVKHLDHYSINAQLALAHKYTHAQSNRPQSPMSEIASTYHFDAGLYGKFLRTLAEKNGVKRIEGKVIKVNQHLQNQHIKSVLLAIGQELDADLFIDCSGMRGLLIEQCLNTGFEDWKHWLPCDSALAVASSKELDLPSYTRSSAQAAGWQWKIPLQHRTGNGHVFSSAFISEQAAEESLYQNLDTKAISDVNHIRFRTGKRRKAWNKNCVAIGLSAGFLEPLESTSLHLVQTAISRLIKLFPDRDFQQANIDQYNQETDLEIERIRDFIIAHYKVTNRDDTEFWRYCRNMEIPDSLAAKLDIFSAYGRVHRETDELFREESWVQVLLGQGLIPSAADPLVALKSPSEIESFVSGTEQVITNCVKNVSSHQAFISQYCRSAE